MGLTVMGDSHAGFWTGKAKRPWEAWPTCLPSSLGDITAIHIGPVTAYKFGQPEHVTAGIVEQILAKFDGPVMVCAGEIDCRAHIAEQANRQAISIRQIIANCIDRYSQILAGIAEKRLTIAWGPIASTPKPERRETDYPTIGSCIDRNHITAEFNDRLRSACQEVGVRFATVFNHMLLKDGSTDPEWLSDGYHLSAKAYPAATKELIAAAPELEELRMQWRVA